MPLKNPFEVVGDSIKFYNKEKNGDAFNYAILGNEELLVAAVADGVSQQPCDWKASAVTIDVILSNFKANPLLPIEDRMKAAVKNANSEVYNTIGTCKNMHTTLSLIVWKYTSNRAYICSIGDSRIYQLASEKIQCITRDDAFVQRRDIYTSYGKRSINSSTLTNVIGRSNINIGIRTIDFQSGELLLIASDGFYEARKSSFENDMRALIKTSNLPLTFSKLIDKYELSAKDDMTAILIKNQN